MAENFHELLARVEQRAEIERVLALERFAHAFVVAHAGTLNARARDGRIREGHGDLRAEHVLVDGGVQLVGCVTLTAGCASSTSPTTSRRWSWIWSRAEVSATRGRSYAVTATAVEIQVTTR